MAPEIARKIVHISFGFCALLLKWLTTWQAAGLALAAFAFNALVLPHVGGKTIARDRARGFDAGILIYPLAVLVLILTFASRPAIAGAVWAIMAFGDGAATIVGRTVGGRSLPWNPTKTWAGFLSFIAVGIGPAYFIFRFLGGGGHRLFPVLIVAVTVFLCAVAESLRTHIDDNLVVPFTGGAAMFALCSVVTLEMPAMDRHIGIWAGVNTLLAIAGYAARSVNLSGMVGGWVLGTVLIVFGGWPLYAVLLAFFTIGTLATKLGYRRKERLGLAQEGGGRRGFNHAFANVGLAAMIALLIPVSDLDPDLLFFMASAALATASADTIGSEIGQLFGRRAFLPLTFRRVERGTEGAVSIEGTLASAVAAAVVAAIAVLLRGVPASAPLLAGIVAGSGFLGAYLESILGSWDRKRRNPIPNDVMNFVNTIFGAVICAGLWRVFAL